MAVHFEQYPYRIVREHFEIGPYTYFHTDLELRTYGPRERIIIGNWCSIADKVMICTGGMRRTDGPALQPLTDSHYRTTPPTIIGNDVWIGMGATVLAGATVGDGAIIATLAVVFSDVPPCAIVAGNPATVIRYRFSKPTVERLLRVAWWDWPIDKIMANRAWFDRPIGEFLDYFDPRGQA